MYDKLTAVPYVITAQSLAAGTSIVLALPKGVRFAHVLECRANITTATVSTTTPARIDIGYAGKSMGMSTMEIPGATALGTVLNSRSPSFHHTGVYQAGATELDNLTLTITPGTGGVVAGAATFTILIGVDTPEVSADDIANFA